MSSLPLPSDPRKPLPGEVRRGQRVVFNLVGGAVIVFGLGVMLGLALAPESPADTKRRLAELEAELALSRQRVLELDRAVQYKAAEKVTRPGGKLSAEDKKRHERESKKYAKILRQLKAQGAAELIQWFIGRW